MTMDWLGIGVLLLGIAFMVLVIMLIKPLKKISILLENVEKTTKQLPDSFVSITDQTISILKEGNDTIINVNNQVKELRPIFEIVNGIGVASQELTKDALEKTMALKQKTNQAASFTHQKQYEGLFGLLSLFYYISQKKNQLRSSLSNIK